MIIIFLENKQENHEIVSVSLSKEVALSLLSGCLSRLGGAEEGHHQVKKQKNKKNEEKKKTEEFGTCLSICNVAQQQTRVFYVPQQTDNISTKIRKTHTWFPLQCER